MNQLKRNQQINRKFGINELPIIDSTTATNVPFESRLPGRIYLHTNRHRLSGRIGQIIKIVQSRRHDTKGILDKIHLCSSQLEAQKLWDDFILSNATPSSKTISKALRLINTLDFSS